MNFSFLSGVVKNDYEKGLLLAASNFRGTSESNFGSWLKKL